MCQAARTMPLQVCHGQDVSRDRRLGDGMAPFEARGRRPVLQNELACARSNTLRISGVQAQRRKRNLYIQPRL
jgi:hypothetical protein